MKIAHVGLWTKDLEAAAAFWVRYFNATVGERYHSRRRLGFVSRFLSLPGGTQIEVMEGPWVGPGVTGESCGWDHVALSLGSREAVDALAAQCEADGILLSKPRLTGDHFYEAVIACPDGTKLEITE